MAEAADGVGLLDAVRRFRLKDTEPEALIRAVPDLAAGGACPTPGSPHGCRNCAPPAVLAKLGVENRAQAALFAHVGTLLEFQAVTVPAAVVLMADHVPFP